ncbi:MAG: hypothetical protein HYU36_07875 [Planctomycetes bacterium]|nr:hypothetical protein [Planctomycetota bacterium]
MRPSAQFHIENDRVRVTLERRHGRILQVRDKAGGLDLILEPRLAENFRLLLPLPGLQANEILGAGQKLTRLALSPGRARLHWSGPLVNRAGRFDLGVTLWIELAGDAIEFRLDVENCTKWALAEAWYPVLGGLHGLGRSGQRKRTAVLVPRGYHQWHRELFAAFGSGECLGVFGGEHAFNYPGALSMPWTSIYHPDVGRAAYFAAHDPVPRCKSLRFGFTPGTAFQRAGGDWPSPAETGDTPVGVTLNWTFHPYTRPGETFQGPPVVLAWHAGGWRESARRYRSWFDAHFGVVDSRGHWLRDEPATLDTMFLLPEDKVSLTFRDIPRWARSAARHGVRCVLISGWQTGGHDRGYPRYEPDPRLGTWGDLEEGIGACHRLGVRVLFFVNVQPADATTPWFRRELHRYVTQDPWGLDYGRFGWGMGTLSARLGMTRTPNIWMSPSIPRVRRIFVGQMKKLAEMGADGVHIDKFLGQPLDFNPRLEASPDRSSWEGMLDCLKEMMAVCRRVNPDFAVSYEGWYDRLLSWSDVVWWAPPGHSAIKVAFPEWVPHVGVTQPYAYNVVNLAVLRGHHLLLGPANYQASMDYPPMRRLHAYVAEVTRIRRDLLPMLSRGEVIDASEPLFRSDKPQLRLRGPFARSEFGQWSVFRDPASGRRAAVLANLGRESLVIQQARFEGGRGRPCRLYRPFRPPRVLRSFRPVRLPAERVAVLVET